MIYFFRRGDASLTCETRLDPEGHGFELVISEQGKTRSERFEKLPAMLAREHELLHAWRALGWREIGVSLRND